mmetsp:Transcript_4702/g.6994  ORF Transcript_4702/g.6994 Transcript_4702/m.6994 type:complete len:229 (-) Transcript_4702:125-811(-)
MSSNNVDNEFVEVAAAPELSNSLLHNDENAYTHDLGEVGEVIEAQHFPPNNSLLDPDDDLDITERNQWVGKQFSCFDDMNSCLLGTCCAPCVLFVVGRDAYEHGGTSPNDCCFDCIAAFFLSQSIICFSPCACTVMFCPHYCNACYQGHILARFRHKYNLPPLPFGKSMCGSPSEHFFPDCCQMAFPCTGPCTLCLMCRQMRAMRIRGTVINENLYDIGWATLPEAME